MFFSWQRGQLLNENLSQKENMLSLFLFHTWLLWWANIHQWMGHIFEKATFQFICTMNVFMAGRWLPKVWKSISFQFGRINLLKLFFSKSHIKSDFLKVSKTSHVHVFANSWKNCLCYQVTNHKIMQIFMGKKNRWLSVKRWWMHF